MNDTQIKELIENLKSAMDTQSRIAIELDASEKINSEVYDSEDLLNALQIFMHVLGNISIGYGIRQGYTEEQLSLLATEMGKSLRQTVQLHTGIDIPSLVKRLYKEK